MAREFQPYKFELDVPDHVRPRPVNRQMFGYDGKLTFRGVEPVQPDELKRLLLEPPGVSVEEKAAWNVEHKKRVTLPWLTAQAKFYDLEDYATQASREDLLAICRSRMQLGNENRSGRPLSPTLYQHSHTALCAKLLEGMIAFWEKRKAVFTNTLPSRSNYEAFMNLQTLEEKLQLDPDLFMDIYFLDRNDTLEPLSFDNTDVDQIKSAVAKVKHLHAKMVGRGKNKKLRIGWDLHEVLYPEEQNKPPSNGSSPPPLKPAVQAEITKSKNRLARLIPHTEYLLEDGPRCPFGPLSGSYHMEITGKGWNDKIYQPNGANMWLDIRPPTITAGVYEATFEFGPALRGMMLISADKGLIRVHSRIMDTMDWDLGPGDDDDEYENSSDSTGDAPFAPGDPRREGFLAGFTYAMKRKRARDDHHEAAFARHKRPRAVWSRFDPSIKPTSYHVLIRGHYHVPDEYLGDEYLETRGFMEFGDDTKLNKFAMEMWGTGSAKGVPQLRPGHSEIRGHRVSDTPLHPAAVPEHDAYGKVIDPKDLTPRQRSRMSGWGALREWAGDQRTHYRLDDEGFGLVGTRGGGWIDREDSPERSRIIADFNW